MSTNAPQPAGQNYVQIIGHGGDNITEEKQIDAKTTFPEISPKYRRFLNVQGLAGQADANKNIAIRFGIKIPDFNCQFLIVGLIEGHITPSSLKYCCSITHHPRITGLLRADTMHITQKYLRRDNLVPQHHSHTLWIYQYQAMKI